jgi:hypothetical protein
MAAVLSTKQNQTGLIEFTELIPSARCSRPALSGRKKLTAQTLAATERRGYSD